MTVWFGAVVNESATDVNLLFTYIFNFFIIFVACEYEVMNFRNG